MKQYGLLGQNIAYSLSPIIHQIIFNKNKTDATYEPYDMAPEKADMFLAHTHCNGLNVTVPYKTAVLKHCKRISKEAMAVGAVNTLTRSDEGWVGDNTDIFGLEKFYEKNSLSFQNQTVIILGTGGAAKAVNHTLQNKHTQHVYRVSRNKRGIGFIGYKELSRLEKTDVLINAMPIGAENNPKLAAAVLHAIERCHTIIDLNYASSESLFLRQEKKAGKKFYNGLDMLIYQAMKSQEIWNGIEITKDLYDDIFLSLQTILEQKQKAGKK